MHGESGNSSTNGSAPWQVGTPISLSLDLTREEREHLMQAYLELSAWPDVRPALQSLRRAGIRLAFLSNATTEILEAGIRNSELEGIFEQALSVDRLRNV